VKSSESIHTFVETRRRQGHGDEVGGNIGQVQIEATILKAFTIGTHQGPHLFGDHAFGRRRHDDLSRWPHLESSLLHQTEKTDNQNRMLRARGSPSRRARSGWRRVLLFSHNSELSSSDLSRSLSAPSSQLSETFNTQTLDQSVNQSINQSAIK
jgi:hypothetical protein